MNVESTSSSVKTTETQAQSQASSSNSAQQNEKTASFKEEMEAVKTQEAKTAETQKNQKTEEENNAQKTKNEQIANDNDKINEGNEKANVTDPLKELNSKIAALNNVLNGSISKVQDIESKSEDKSTDKINYCTTMKMDNNDISFFLNLVDNKQMAAQTGQGVSPNSQMVNFTDVKAEATQASVKVSATLLDALNQSVKTNKPFRIDFDSDIAVIMKVDKDGVLSANFIPGSSAVENYLRNNIASLRQSFEEQNLPYNELSYQNRQKQEQQEKQQSQNNKEKENE